jgi:hypothetical protein
MRIIALAAKYDATTKLYTLIIFSFSIVFIAAFCSVQLARYFGVGNDWILIQQFDLFRIDRDGTLAEWFNYLQTIMCVTLLLGVYRATRQPVYAAWAMVFSIVVADDSLMLHERASHYFVGALGIPALPGLRPHESGELLAWAMIGIVLVGILWWGFARSGRSARIAGAVLALAFAALIFFAIGLDILHVAFAQTGTALYALFAVLEDGGEMLSIGLACALALLLYRHPTIAG